MYLLTLINVFLTITWIAVGVISYLEILTINPVLKQSVFAFPILALLLSIICYRDHENKKLNLMIIVINGSLIGLIGISFMALGYGLLTGIAPQNN
jgi:hypothetical protein